MLIARRVRSTIWLVVGGCVVVTVLLVTVYPGLHLRRRVDVPFDSWLRSGVAGRHTLLELVAALGEPPGVLVECAVIIALCVVGHRWRAAVLAAIGPAVAVALTEWALKPLTAHLVASYLVFPSGHVAATSGVATVVAVVLLGPSRPPWPPWVRGVLIAVVVLGTAAVAVAVVGLRWHLMTDTVGGICVGVATVLVLARALEAVGTPADVPRALAR